MRVQNSFGMQSGTTPTMTSISPLNQNKRSQTLPTNSRVHNFHLKLQVVGMFSEQTEPIFPHLPRPIVSTILDVP